MVRHFPINDQSLLPAHFGFWPGNSTTPGEVSNRVFSPKIPVVCRKLHSKQPFGMFKGENAMNYAFSTFLIEAIIIIFFIKVVSIALRPFRQPRIVSEIIVRRHLSCINFFVVDKIRFGANIDVIWIFVFEGWNDDRTIDVWRNQKFQLLFIPTNCELHMRKHRTDGVFLLPLPHGGQDGRWSHWEGTKKAQVHCCHRSYRADNLRWKRGDGHARPNG